MLRLLVDSHPHFVKILCFLLPMLVLLLGPRDSVLRRLWNLQPLRMWHWETLAVMVAVYLVIGLAGDSPGEWIGFAALVFAHGRNSVMFRLTEQQRESSPVDPHHVECWRWNSIYFFLGEVGWAAYFIYHESWAGLAGVGIFTGYAQWRRWYTRRQAVIRSEVADKVAEAAQEKCSLCSAALVKPDCQLRNIGPASPVKRPDGMLVCLGCDMRSVS
jgi:hypothetical protein